MRLVCPNCGAQYEVDDRVMPEMGRDVQCSNCGHTWFHTPPERSSAAPEDTPEPKIEIPAPAPSPTSSIDETDAVSEPEPNTDPEPDTDVNSQEREDALEVDTEASSETEDQDPTGGDPTEDDGGVEDDDGDTEDTSPPIAAAPRKEVSEEVKQILQEEAEQELRAREADQQGLETQPDLGLDAAQNDGSEELSERIRRMKDEEDFVEEEVQEKDLRSRDMLPDIEEINSTLDAPDDDGETKIDLEPAAAIVAKSGNGFRRGFSLTILLAVLLVCLYVLAPQIAGRFPQTQGVLDQYTAIGDSARLWLEGAMQSAIEKMRGLMDASPEG